MWVVRETLEKPSAQAAVGTMDWVFLSALIKAEMETVLCDAAKLHGLQEREEAPEAWICTLEGDL